MPTLLISDLHLDAARPEIGEQFLAFAAGEARDADALYILGDLFESWVGDDDPNPHYAAMKAAIREISDAGVPVYFMHGNRDFMIGERFADETGVRMLPDPTIVDLYGSRVLLGHGDAWCTDDTEYQALRTLTRNPEWQAAMLQKPLEIRLAIAAGARSESQARNAMLPENIMDVNRDTIDDTMRRNGVRTILHGHTHRPAVHRFELDGDDATRIVLGDWYDHGSVVRWDADGFSLDEIPR